MGEKRRGIFSKEEAKSASETPGVYFVYSNKTFFRLKGKTNIVYIGVAKSSLFKRLIGSRKALYRFIRLENNGHKLTYKVKKRKTEQEAKSLEKKELMKFEKKHLELPPLNHSN